MLTDFGFVLLFILGAVGLFLIVMGIAWFIRPSKPTFEKLTSYESGEEAIGGTNVRFTVRYYLVALVFVLFDVELVFLFPLKSGLRFQINPVYSFLISKDSRIIQILLI